VDGCGGVGLSMRGGAPLTAKVLLDSGPNIDIAAAAGSAKGQGPRGCV
jgi:hypothetical protein